MKTLISTLLLLVFFAAGCSQQGNKQVAQDPSVHVEWAKNAVIYEVNIRQYTNEGTFRAFEQELPRLQRMGVDILWLMPIHPVGEKNRKGSLGSYYAVKDYYGINPEFGTKEDFSRLVRRAHELGMEVIIDWVANHTAWDNPLITGHPDWYKKDSLGNIIPPVADWTDVAALDYSRPELHQYMTDALLYWVREFDIDGYRCDVAGMVPVSFWRKAIPEIKKIKPVFMLAEDEQPVMHDSAYFDATYSWGIFHLMNDIAKGKKSPDRIDSALAAEAAKYPPDAFRMRFTSNHDENSWNGTEFERMGDGARTFAVLTYTIPGMPLIYTGQESGLKKRLKFFEKDTVPWGGYSHAGFYATLNALKKKNDLLAAGKSGGLFIPAPNSASRYVYSFIRKSDNRKILVILNFSDKEQVAGLSGNEYPGSYTEVFTGQKKTISAGETITLNPWEYLVYESD